MSRVLLTALFFCFVSFFLCSVAGAQIAMRYKAAGEAGFGKDIFKFESAIAKWNAQEKTLEVGFFPFVVDDEDTEKVVKWHMMFYATVGKLSPNPVRWSSPPYVILMMRFSSDLEMYTINDVASYGINVVGVKGESTTAVFLTESQAKEIIKALQFSPGNIESLTLLVNEIKDRNMLEGFRYKVKIGD